MSSSTRSLPLLASALLVGLAVIGCREQRFDPRFDARVAEPAYPAVGPRVAIDEAHRNRHTLRTGYQPFARLLASDGYRVERGRRSFTPDFLRDFDVLVIAGAMGANDTGDSSAFTSGEIASVREWVRGGGSLLLVVDHYPFGPAARELAGAFGVAVGDGLTEDSLHFDQGIGDASHLVFSLENGLLADHPILRGRRDEEAVARVVTFTGTSLRAATGAALLRLASTAVDLTPAVTVAQSGGDTRVAVSYLEPRPSRGDAQAVALRFGEGRVVVVGEAAALTAQLDRNGRRIGMSQVGSDNRQFVLNVLHWLSRLH